MRNWKYIFVVLALLLGVACSGPVGTEGPDVPQQPDTSGLIKLNVFNVNPVSTRAGQLVNMKPYSTIRLYVLSAGSAEKPNPHMDNKVGEYTLRVRDPLEINDPKTYAGHGALILCEVDENGQWVADVTDTDIHLPVSYYEFYAISPAVETEPVNFNNDPQAPGYEFNHGTEIELLSAAPVSANLGYTSPEVGGSTPGFYNLTLNPFMLLGTQISLHVIPGDKTQILEFESRGVEISQLTADAYKPNFILGQTDLIPMEAGAMGMVNIPYSPAKHRYVENGAIVPNEYLFVTQIIPHKTGQETPVKFRFHVMVNGGNYKAYFIELPNQHYERAKSYNYTVQVNVGGIFLTGWSINEWDTTIPGSN